MYVSMHRRHPSPSPPQKKKKKKPKKYLDSGPKLNF